MNKRAMTQSPQAGIDYFGLIICGATFICGCVAGTMSAGLAAQAEFTGYLTGLLPVAEGAAAAEHGFTAILMGACKYHLAVVFFGFSLLGIVCLPVLSAVRGFFLCFSISAIVRHFGGDGVFLALAVSGISALITLPCFFVLSVQAFSASLRLLGSVTSGGIRSAFAPYDMGYFRRIIVCFAVLACAALVEMLAVPGLVAHIAAGIT